MKPTLIWIVAVMLWSAAASVAWCQDAENTDSDQKALEVLKSAEAQIYSPLEHGLKTLTYQQVFALPNRKQAIVSTSFQAPDQTAFSATVSRGVANARAMENSLLNRSWNGCRMTLGTQLGRPITMLLDHFIVTFADDADGVSILLEPKKTTEESKLDNIVCTINKKGLIKSIKGSFTHGGTTTEIYQFKKYKDTDLLLVDYVDSLMETPFGDQKTKKIYDYSEVDGFHLIRSFTLEILVQGETKESLIGFTDITVNKEIDPEVFKKKEKVKQGMEPGIRLIRNKKKTEEKTKEPDDGNDKK